MLHDHRPDQARFRQVVPGHVADRPELPLLWVIRPPTRQREARIRRRFLQLGVRACLLEQSGRGPKLRIGDTCTSTLACVRSVVPVHHLAGTMRPPVGRRERTHGWLAGRCMSLVACVACVLMVESERLQHQCSARSPGRQVPGRLHTPLSSCGNAVHLGRIAVVGVGSGSGSSGKTWGRRGWWVERGPW